MSDDQRSKLVGAALFLGEALVVYLVGQVLLAAGCESNILKGMFGVFAPGYIGILGPLLVYRDDIRRYLDEWRRHGQSGFSKRGQ